MDNVDGVGKHSTGKVEGITGGRWHNGKVPNGSGVGGRRQECGGKRAVGQRRCRRDETGGGHWVPCTAECGSTGRAGGGVVDVIGVRGCGRGRVGGMGREVEGVGRGPLGAGAMRNDGGARRRDQEVGGPVEGGEVVGGMEGGAEEVQEESEGDGRRGWGRKGRGAMPNEGRMWPKGSATPRFYPPRASSHYPSRCTPSPPTQSRACSPPLAPSSYPSPVIPPCTLNPSPSHVVFSHSVDFPPRLPSRLLPRSMLFVLPSPKFRTPCPRPALNSLPPTTQILSLGPPSTTPSLHFVLSVYPMAIPMASDAQTIYPIPISRHVDTRAGGW